MCVVQMNEPAVLSTKLSGQVGRCLKWRIARTYDADALLRVLPTLPCYSHRFQICPHVARVSIIDAIAIYPFNEYHTFYVSGCIVGDEMMQWSWRE